MTLRRLVASLLISLAALAGCGVLVDGRDDRLEAEAESRFPPEGKFLTVNGRRVHYVEAGKGPDLILLHGASGNTREMTFDLLDRVKGRYHTVVFDRPGLGYTDRISNTFEGATNTRAESPQEQAAFLKAAADQLGVRRPIVLGHSYGGAVAMAWALNHDPAAVVIVSGATEPWPGGLGALYNISASSLGGAGLVPLITAFASEKLTRETVTSIFAPQDPPEGYIDHIGVGLSLRRASFRANARQVVSLRPHLVEMSKRYPTLDLPVEILHGTADTTVPIGIHADRLVLDVPNAHLERLDGIGHMLHHAAPERVVAAINRAARRAGLR